MTISNIDPGLKQFGTPRQAEYIDAIIKHGSIVAAAAELGVNEC